MSVYCTDCTRDLRRGHLATCPQSRESARRCFIDDVTEMRAHGEPAFWDCSMWRQTAEKLGELAWPKGHPVIVVGKLKQRSYEDKQGGKRRATDLLVDAVGADEVALSRRQSSTPAQPAGDPWRKAEPAADPWAAPKITEAPF